VAAVKSNVVKALTMFNNGRERESPDSAIGGQGAPEDSLLQPGMAWLVCLRLQLSAAPLSAALSFRKPCSSRILEHGDGVP
jgi:hypothetical protein